MMHNSVLHVWEKYGSSIMAYNALSHQTAVFFDHQYLWKESMDPLDFLLGGNQEDAA